MIVPMKKVSVVLLESEKREALQRLRSLGVMHLEQLSGSGDTLAAAKEGYEKLVSAYMLVSDIKTAEAKRAVQLSDRPRAEVEAKADEVCALYERSKSCREQINALTGELDRYRSWGEVDGKDFAFLAEKGIGLRLCEIPADSYGSVSAEVKTIPLSRDKSAVRFIAVSYGDWQGEALPSEAYVLPLPALSTGEMRSRIKELEAEIASNEAKIAQTVPYRSLFKSFQKDAEKDVEFENVFSGMEGEAEGETRLAWISGFIPAPDMQTIEKASKDAGWAFMARDPDEEDAVPTKLKNNKLVSMIYPLTDFLGTVPGYREYDISGWFLLFFCVFFGMIFGDGGYGLLLTIVALWGICSARAKKKQAEPALNLLFILGLSTVVWGTLTCTWFGLTPDQLPSWLTGMSLSLISNAEAAKGVAEEAAVKQNLQIFCFGLALLQLSIAHLKGIARYIKSPKALGELGSLLMLWGMFNIVLSLVVDGTRFPIRQESILLIAAGFALSFIFSNYEGSVLASVLESLKNIISVLLGVVNVFSDIVSYIRLWAVGLAGGAISSTVNSMAGPTIGGALIFLGILLLVFGHGLNMVLNVLSVIVHGVRLNTLEFSTHLGMSWSGFAYEPFRETGKK